MSNFELITCCILIPINFVLFYIAGRNDLFGTICASLKDWSDETKSQSTKMGEWISVKDRLPEYDQAVLCYKSDRGVRFGKILAATYADGVQAFMDCERKYAFGATHWMPLPEPPVED